MKTYVNYLNKTKFNFNIEFSFLKTLKIINSILNIKSE